MLSGNMEKKPNKSERRLKQKSEKKLLRQKNKIRKLEKSLLKAKNKEDTQQGNKEDSTASLGREFTVSIALPGSILDNAQSPELRTYLAGQVARALVIFQVSYKIVLY